MRKGQKMPEHLRKQRSEYMKKNPLNYWQGKKRTNFKLSDEGREKIVKALQTREVSQKVIDHVANLNKGKFGKDHPKWTENKKHPIRKAIRELYKYRKWRTSIFKRDGYTCQLCGKNKCYVEADHYPKRFAEILDNNNIHTIEDAIMCEEIWKAEGRTLCKPCHLETIRK